MTRKQLVVLALVWTLGTLWGHVGHDVSWSHMGHDQLQNFVLWSFLDWWVQAREAQRT